MRTSLSRNRLSSTEAGWTNHALVIGLGILGTALSCLVHRSMSGQIRREGEHRFDAVARDTTRSLAYWATRPASGLRGVRGLYAASHQVERAEFGRYVSRYSGGEELPGVLQMGLLQVVRPHDLETFVATERADGAPAFDARLDDRATEHWIVKFAEPAHAAGLPLGADVGGSSAFLETLHRCVEQDDAMITPLLTMPRAEHAVTVWLLPVFANDQPTGTSRHRWSNLVGVLFATLDPAALAGVVDDAGRSARIVVREGVDSVAGSLLLQVDHSSGSGAEPRFTSSRAIGIGGRTWALDAGSLDAFDEQFSRSEPTLAGIGGTVVSWSIAALFWSILTARRRAIDIAHDRTEHLNRMMEEDELTGLANRSRFTDVLEHALARHRRDGSLFAVLFFDFDRFKVINDSLGHQAGDALLRSIADRFRVNLRNVDTAARFGGDEFTVLLDDLTYAGDAQHAAETLLAAFAEPHDIDGHRVVTTASIGLVTAERGYASAGDMIRDADAAMYQAKATGRDRIVTFDQKLHERAVERLALEEDLRTAVERDELVLMYQPIVDLSTGRMRGVESLVRWRHATRGLISPALFIPIAEETGLIAAVGDWVLDRACRQLADWKRRGIAPDGFTVSVNVAKRQLLDQAFGHRVIRCLATHGLDVTDVKIEVTETTVIDNRSEVSRILEAMREQSITVVMDDFGTGHSSLSGLHMLPVDEIKIDQSFIRHGDQNQKLIAIVAAITALADNLSMRTVGEGAETAEHVATLQSLGCDYGQGHYFSMPVPADELERLLQNPARQAA